MSRSFIIRVGCLLLAIAVSTTVRGGEPAPEPLAREALVGDWRGDQGEDFVELHVAADGSGKWIVRARKELPLGRTTAQVEADLTVVDDQRSGTVEILFRGTDKPSSPVGRLTMGRVARGEDGVPRLTMLPDARRQSEDYYVLFEDLPLRRIEKE